MGYESLYTYPIVEDEEIVVSIILGAYFSKSKDTGVGSVVGGRVVSPPIFFDSSSNQEGTTTITRRKDGISSCFQGETTTVA